MGRNNWQTFNWTFFPWWETNRHKVRWFFCARVCTKYQSKFQSILDVVRGLCTMELRRILAEWLGNFWINILQINGLVVEVLLACSFSGSEFIRFSLVGTFKIYRTRNVDWKCWNTTKQNRARLPTNSRNTKNDWESNQISDKTRAGLSSNVVISSIFCKSN